MFTKPYKKDSGSSYALGVYPTIELLKFQGKKATKVFINPKGERNRGVAEILQFCDRYKIPISKSQGLIEQMSRNENTYAVGIFNKYYSDIIPDQNHVVLVKPSDTGNFGTICRTMLGFGVKNLAVIKPAVDIFDPKVVSSTMGAIFQVNFKYYGSIEEYIKEFSNHHIYTFMLDGAKDIREVKFEEPFSMVQGSESSGLPGDFKSLGQSVYIPQSKDIDSLNLSVATAIGLWESSKK